jgi:hypothetical protein
MIPEGMCSLQSAPCTPDLPFCHLSPYLLPNAWRAEQLCTAGYGLLAWTYVALDMHGRTLATCYCIHALHSEL